MIQTKKSGIIKILVFCWIFLANASLIFAQCPSVSINNANICPSSGEIATITATPSTASNYTYVWSVPSGFPNPGNVASFNTNVAGTYTVSLTNTNYLCNTDFELPDITKLTGYGNGTIQTKQVNVPCWKTTDATYLAIELWNNSNTWTTNPHVNAYSGTQFAELNALSAANLYQDFTVIPGSIASISFAHRGRSGTDVMEIQIGPIGGPYVSLGQFSDGNSAWGLHTASYTFPNNSNTNYRILFIPVSSTGGDNSFGNFLDAININLTSCNVSASGVVTINNGCTVANTCPTVSVNDASICSTSGGIATITATPSIAANYNYTWSVPAGAANPGNKASFTTTVTGTYTVTLTSTNYLCNTDFDDNQIVGAQGWLITSVSNVPCWKSGDGFIELWKYSTSNPYNGGVYAYSGTQFAELNASNPTTLYQDFTIIPGSTASISFAHRGRNGTDVMEIKIGPVGGPYVSIGQFSDGKTAWGFQSVNYTFPISSNTTYRISFSAVSTSNGNLSEGNFLDAISIKLNTCTPTDAGVVISSCCVAPTITTQPLPQTICAGANTTFTVAATGGNGQYQWQVNNGSGWTDIANNTTYSGATAATLNISNATTAMSTYQYRCVVKEATGNCPSTSNAATLTVNPIPGTTAVSNQTICAGLSIPVTTFSSTPTGASFSWSNSNTNTGIVASGTGNMPTYTAASVTTQQISTISVTPTLNGCTGTPITFTVTVNPLPTINTLTNQTVCGGATIAATTFSSTPSGATYAWTNGNATTGIPLNGTGSMTSYTASSVSAQQISTITITPTLNSCVGSTKLFTITVNPVPTMNSVSSQTICGGNVISATSFTSTPTGSTFAWSNDNTNTAIVASGNGNMTSYTAASVTSQQISTITVTPTLNSCIGPTKQFTITVNPVPSTNAISSQTICANGTITAVNFASTPSGATFAWNNNNTSTGIGTSGNGNFPTATAANVSSQQTSVITVTPTLNGCVGSPSNFNILVNPIPQLTISCGTATISSVQFNWNNLASATSYNYSYTINGGTPIIGSLPAGSATLPVTGLGQGENVILTLTPQGIACATSSIWNCSSLNCPNPIVNAVTNKTACSGASVAAINFSSPTAGATFSWINNNPAIGLPASGTGNIAQFTAANISTTQTATIFVKASDGICTGPTTTFTITINQLPTINALSNQTVCGGSTITATSFTSSPSGATFAWNNGNTLTGIASNGTGNMTSYSASAVATQQISTISITPTLNTCVGNPTSFTVTVNPVPSVNTITNQTICGNATIPATNFSSIPAGATYAWSNGNTNTGIPANGTGNTSTYTASNVSSQQISTVIVTPTLNGCIGNPANYTITINPLPTTNAISNQTICGGGVIPATSFSSSPTGSTFAWSNSNANTGIAASGTGNMSTYTASSVSSQQVSIITVTPSLNGCIGNPANFTYTINPVPSVNTISNQTICGGSSIAATNFTSTPLGSSFAWSNGNTATGIASNGAGNMLSSTASLVTSQQISTITVTPTLNSCVGTPKQFTITANPVPSINAVSNQTVCGGTAITGVNFSSVPSGATYNWTNNNINTSISGIGVGNLISVTASNVSSQQISTIYITPTLSGCVGNPISFSITVNPVPSVNPISNQSACSGTSISPTVFASTPSNANFAWSNNNSATGIGSLGSGNIALTTASTVTSTEVSTITVIPTLNGCTGNSAQFTIQVNPLPTAEAGATQTITCANKSAQLNGNGSSSGTYLWSGGAIDAGQGSLTPTTKQAGNYTLKVTDANGCIASDQVLVSISLDVPIADAGSDQTIDCAQNLSGVQIGNTAVSGINYAWSSIPIGFNSTNAQENVNPTVTTTYTITATNPINGCNASKQVIITVDNTLPIANAGSTKEINCYTSSVLLDGSASSSGTNISYEWKNSAGTSLGYTSKTTVSQPDTYTLFVTNITNNCKANSTVTVTKNTPPPPVDAGVDASICAGKSTTLSASGGDSYRWSNGINQSTQSVTPTPNATIQTNTTYTVTATKGTCTASDQVIITVNPIPNPAIDASPPAVCSGDATELTASTGDTYLWSTTETTNKITVTPTTETKYTVTITTNGCSNTAQMLVSINPGVNITVNPPEICAGGTATLKASGGTQYEWSEGLGNTQSIAVSPLSTSSYSVTVTNAEGCSASANITVNVNPLPSVTINASNTEICSGANTSLSTITNATVLSYLWSPASANTSQITIGPANSTIYTVSITDSKTCTASNSTFIKVKPTPIADAGPDQIICIGQQAQLNASGGTGQASFLWMNNTQGLSSLYIANPTANITTAGKTTFTVNVSEEGCFDTDDITIEVNPLPNVDAGVDQSICQGNATTIKATGGSSYLWNTGTPLNASVISASPSSNTKYIVTATLSGCTASDFMNIIVNPLPNVNFSADSLHGCAPLPVNFTNLSTNAISWNWNFSDVHSATNGSAIPNPYHIFNQAGSYSIILSVKDNNNCSNTLTKSNMINVNEMPTADFTWTPELASFSNPELRFSAASSSANVVSWNWHLTDSQSKDTTANMAMIIHTYSVPGEYPVKLIVSTALGCKDTITKIVRMKEDYLFYIPNAFSPNGNGDNDYFGPVGVGIDPNNFEMYIFSRWGQLIYQTTDLNKPWDGRLMDGSEAMVGVYSWLIYAQEKEGKKHSYIGKVTLIK